MSHGNAGIYFSISGGVLRINVKTYVDGKIVPNITTIPVSGNDLMIVDADGVISVMVSGTKIVTIELKGTADYGISGIAADKSVATAVLTIAGQAPKTIEKVIAAATNFCDVGVATRGGGTMEFTAISLMPANSVEVPEFPSYDIIPDYVIDGSQRFSLDDF